MATRSPDERLTFRRADAPDVAAVLELRTATARDLTRRFGRGHWSIEGSERGVLNDLRVSQVWLALRGRAAVATFRLSTRKPWAIDASYFTRITRPVYLTDMAVHPETQRRGIGRQCVDEVIALARRWPADVIRLDAYDAAAGAGDFYARCGFREVGRVSYRGNRLVYFEMMLEGATGNVAGAR
jgi:GNAT superfamily N-acetyltransferase